VKGTLSLHGSGMERQKENADGKPVEAVLLEHITK
jgi:hypothetical protein